jgi:hypothetical protein
MLMTDAGSLSRLRGAVASREATPCPIQATNAPPGKKFPLAAPRRRYLVRIAAVISGTEAPATLGGSN